MPSASRQPDAFDSTIAPYPRADAIRQPCRTLLTEILVLQGDNPPKSPQSKAVLERARKKVRGVMRDVVADEKSCFDSLKRIEDCSRTLFGGENREPAFTNPRVAELWERLLSLTQSNAVDGVLTDLSEFSEESSEDQGLL